MQEVVGLSRGWGTVFVAENEPTPTLFLAEKF